MDFKFSKKIRMALPLVIIGGVLTWMYYPSFTTPGPFLTFKIEGLIDSKINFRDAGTSINECAGQRIFEEGRLLRSSGFFSGWSCYKIGNPDIIYSLNYSKEEGRRYYCRGSVGHTNGVNVGVFFQNQEISDIELLPSWDNNPEQVRSVCNFMSNGIRQIKIGKKVLYHCEAGRDRTGAVIALIAAYQMEQAGELSDQSIAALECDYRKSQSLDKEKYGRIQRLLEILRARGGVRKFIHERCGDLFSGI